MDKSDFLLRLEKSLMVLEEKELRDIINEYEQHIDMKVKNGLSEEEAIADFGSLPELTSEILEAYHVRSDYAMPGKDFKVDGEKHDESEKTAADSFSRRDSLKKGMDSIGSGMKHAAGWTWSKIKRVCARIWAAMVKMTGGIWKLFMWCLGQVCRPFVYILGLIKGRRTEDEDGIEIDAKEKMKEETVMAEKKVGIGTTIGNGIMAMCRWCVDACVWCIRLTWNCACVGTSLIIGFFGICALFGFGMLVVLLINGYPLWGVTIACFGATLSIFAAAIFCITLIWHGKKPLEPAAPQAVAGKNELVVREPLRGYPDADDQRTDSREEEEHA